jgi:ATP-dependent helicase/nuclease subunit A
MTVSTLDNRDDNDLHPEVVQRRAADPTASVWVGASAGTGKTKVLTDRVLRLLLTGTAPDRILCLTFTKAAAAEMANRVANRLAAWATMPDAGLEDALAELTGGGRPDREACDAARRLFARVLDTPGGLAIQTIHSFCQSLLRRFPIEASLPPHFEVLDDRGANEIMREARAHVLRAALLDPDSALGRARARVTRWVQADEFDKLLATLSSERARLDVLFSHHGDIDGVGRAVYQTLNIPPDQDPDALLQAGCADDAFAGADLRAACCALLQGTKTDIERADRLSAWLAAPLEGRVDRLGEYGQAFFTTTGELRKTLATKAVVKIYPGIVDTLTREAERLQRLKTSVSTAHSAANTLAVLRLANEILARYAAQKQRRALLDYDDLIARTVALLDRSDMAAWVLFKLDGGIDHILVDEAQDTNPDQWRVVSLLADEFFSGEGARSGRARTIFAVGDEKQSIYSFQRADPDEFRRMRSYFQQRISAAEHVWRPLKLTISFRSTRAVLEAVDAVFNHPQARDGVVVGDDTRIEHSPFRKGHAGLVELWPALVPDEAAQPDPWAAAAPQAGRGTPSTTDRLAGIIAATVAGWLANGEMLPARGRPVHPGDVLVLVRRRNALVPALVAAFTRLGVPVAGVDRIVLTESIAVMDLLALADFLLLPDDDLTLATVLKGPLIGLDEETLFTLAHGRNRRLWPTLVALAQAGDGPLQRIVGYLSDLMGRVDFLPPYELLARVLATPCPADPISGQRAFAHRLGGEVREPVDELLNLALTFQRTHAPALQSFVAWLRTGEAEVKREQEGAGAGLVRIMTVHGSKGLQAPIVFLPDTVQVPTQTPSLFWPEQADGVPLWVPRKELHGSVSTERLKRAEQARDREYRRLLYVAMTRAEDRLYVCGATTSAKGTRPEGCWYDLIHGALHPVAEPCDFDFTALDEQLGWQGSGLRLRTEQHAPAKPEATRAADAAPPPLPDWARARRQAEPSPAKPLAPSRPDNPEPAVQSPLASGDGARFRRGTITHRLLQSLPDLPPERWRPAAAAFLARPVHGLSAEQQAEILSETLAVLQHPDFAAIFAPGSRAEVPITGIIGHRVLSGQIDRLVVLPDQVLIVDFKTNRPPPQRLQDVAPDYLTQLALYRQTLAEIYPGRTIRCALLWTDGPLLMEVPE